jgi:hypothetical protein
MPENEPNKRYDTPNKYVLGSYSKLSPLPQIVLAQSHFGIVEAFVAH